MRLSVKFLLCISQFEFKIVAPEGALNQSKLLIDNFSKNGFKGRRMSNLSFEFQGTNILQWQFYDSYENRVKG